MRRLLPGEALLYAGDSAHAPYGDKAADFIIRRSLKMAGFLERQGAKALVVACNTATAVAVEALRAGFDLPIVGMEPAVKPATEITRSGVVGVLATIGTLRSARFAALLDRFGSQVRVVTQPCPGLVEAVEAGRLRSRSTRKLVDRYTNPLVAQGADVIVLGCTHYPFLRPLVEQAAGAGVHVLDTGEAVARQLGRRLDSAGLLSDQSVATAPCGIWTSQLGPGTRTLLQRLWQGPFELHPLPR